MTESFIQNTPVLTAPSAEEQEREAEIEKIQNLYFLVLYM